MHMQTAANPQQTEQSPAQLRDQIREQVRQQVEAAREQAREAGEAAREEARAAARASQTPQPPAPPGEPVVVVRPPGVGGNEIPPQAVDLAIAFFAMIAVIIIGLPIARAFARRLDRKAVPPAMNRDVVAQLQRIEHAVEAMAIEVERISEAQRYMARLQSERAAEPAALPQSGARE
jgi:hypothetical protein